MSVIEIAPSPDVLVERTPANHGRTRAARSGRSWTRMRRVRRALSGALLAIVALASIVAAILVISLRIGFSPVLSPSMEPAFGPGDLVLTRPLAATDIKVGQVIVLPIPEGGAGAGERYVHRVISVTHDKQGHTIVKTKGDNNPSADPWTLRVDSAKVPHVIGDVPKVGRLSLLFRGPALRITLLLLVAGGALLGIKRALLNN